MLEFRRCPYFVWNGVKSTEFGVFITEFPDIVRAEERVTFTTVQGRSGSLTQLEGEDVHDDVTLSIECGIKDFASIRRASSILRGNGRLALPYRPHEYTNARVINQISFEEFLKARPNREFKINFRCDPFWYDESPSVIVLNSDMGKSAMIGNGGDVAVRPVITITGSGSGTLTFNGSVVELADVEDGIVLDCEAQEAYNDVRGMNDHMIGDFPVITKGVNFIRLDGDFDSARIVYRAAHLI